jgi:hypothetical protein
MHIDTLVTILQDETKVPVCDSTVRPQISILIVDNGLEYTALSELRRVPLTRATNADFAHRYELYIINWEVGG